MRVPRRRLKELQAAVGRNCITAVELRTKGGKVIPRNTPGKVHCYQRGGYFTLDHTNGKLMIRRVSRYDFILIE